MRRITVTAFLIISVALLAACAGSKPVTTRLDEKTGVTVVTVKNPIVVARPNRLSGTARDYAYLGPVEVNRMDERDHFLWVGLASTVDREPASAAPQHAKTLALLVDGVPMMLPLTKWNADLQVPPYDGSLPIHASFAVRASLDEIGQIGRATSVEMHIITDSGSALAYQHWGGDWAAWASFAAFVPGNP